MTLKTNNGEKEIIKTEWGKRIEDVIFETGLSIRAFANLVGYKHPSTFYAAIKDRKISPKLMSKILEGYRKKLDKELNPQWIEKAIQPKLLTIKNELKVLEIVNEQDEKYKSTCKKCIEKDKEIDQLKSELIQCLKELSGFKKTSSG